MDVFSRLMLLFFSDCEGVTMEKDKRRREEKGGGVTINSGASSAPRSPKSGTILFSLRRRSLPPPISISPEFRMEIVFPMAEAPSHLPLSSPFYSPPRGHYTLEMFVDETD